MIDEKRVRAMATPHARGSTSPGGWVRLLAEGYPACAGIDLMDL